MSLSSQLGLLQNKNEMRPLLFCLQAITQSFMSKGGNTRSSKILDVMGETKKFVGIEHTRWEVTSVQSQLRRWSWSWKLRQGGLQRAVGI